MTGTISKKLSSRQGKHRLLFSLVFMGLLLGLTCPRALPADDAAMQLAQQQTPPSPAAPTAPPVFMDPPGVSKPVIAPAKPGVQPTDPSPASSASTPQPATGQSGQDQQVVPTKQQPQATAGSGVKKGQVSLNFDDADIYSVIQTIFANILRQNYVIDPRVKGRVTFRSVTPVPDENVLPLMEIILRLNGIAIVEESGLFRIVPMSDAPREPAPIGYGRDPQGIQLSGKALLQVVPLRYLQSTEMVKLITPFVSTNAVIVDVPKSNHMIIVDTDSNVRRLLRLINLFDNEQQKEKRPQVFVYNVQNGKAKDMATLLQQIFLGARPPASAGTPTAPATPPSQQTRPTPPATPPAAAAAPQMTGEALVADSTKIYSDDILNAVIIVATAEDFASIKQTIDKIDIVPRQVLIEAVIASVNLTDNMSLGIAWSMKANLGGIFSSTIGFNAPIATPTSAVGGFSFTAIDPGGDVRALISALATKSKAKFLATPHIVVSDNREARIQVGKQVPIVTSETYGSLNVSQQRNIQYKDIGIILKVKPRINEGGLVSIELNQEISTYEKIKLYANEDQIIINKNDVSTNLVVQDNQTIVIGGLIQEDISSSNQGIPWLNKIPILGYLFGSTADESAQQEIVILLTPRVMKSIQDANDVTSEYTERFSNVGIEKGKGKAPAIGEINKGIKSAPKKE